MVKNGYYRNNDFIFAWDLGVTFLVVPNWVIRLKGVMEKCVGCFHLYLFWGEFFI